LGSQFKPAETLHVVQKDVALVTSDLFEAFLTCPFKCFLISKDEIPTGSDYTNWHAKHTESYRSEGVNKLTTDYPREMRSGVLESRRWKNASWHFALDQVVRTQDCEARLQVVQRMPAEGTNHTAQLVPIRFVPANKLSSTEKMIAAFDAMVLAKSLGIKIGIAKIVHGEKWSVTTVKANLLSRSIHTAVSQATALLTSASPPELILNRHCPECEYQDRCRKQAVEKDDLSLLTHLADKDRARLKSKGIFTVTQLSYTLGSIFQLIPTDLRILPDSLGLTGAILLHRGFSLLFGVHDGRHLAT
jgi:predicted RecB family nuclease